MKNKKIKLILLLLILFLIIPSIASAAKEKILIYVIQSYADFDISKNLTGYDVKYKVRSEQEEITDNFLSSYNQVWLINGQDNISLYLTDDEKKAIYNFKDKKGGDLLISVDHKDYGDFQNALSPLASYYGVKFSGCWRTGSSCLEENKKYCYPGNCANEDCPKDHLFKMANHPFWTGINNKNKVGTVSSTNSDAFMEIDNTNSYAENLKALAWIGDKPYGTILLDEGKDKGRVVFDNSFARFYKGHSACPSANDPQYHQNIADWLSGKEPLCTLTANPRSIITGGTAILNWSSKNAHEAKINQGIGNITSVESGSIKVSPNSTTRYVMTVKGVGGDSFCETIIRIQKPLPVISGPCQNLVPCGTSKNPKDCKLSDIFVMIQNIVNCLVFISTIICLLFIVIGGLLYIFSLGNPENLTKAKNTILWALGGLALVFLAWLIVNTMMYWMGVDESFLMWNRIG